MGKERIVYFGERPFGAIVILLDGKSGPGRISMQKVIAGERQRKRKAPRELYPQWLAWGLSDGRCSVNVWKMNVGMKYTPHSLIIIFKNRQYFLRAMWQVFYMHYPIKSPKQLYEAGAIIMYFHFTDEEIEAWSSCTVSQASKWRKWNVNPGLCGSRTWVLAFVEQGPAEKWLFSLGWVAMSKLDS